MAAFTCKDHYIVAYDSYIFPWDLAKKKDLLVGFSFQKNNSILKHKSRRAPDVYLITWPQKLKVLSSLPLIKFLRRTLTCVVQSCWTLADSAHYSVINIRYIMLSFFHPPKGKWEFSPPYFLEGKRSVMEPLFTHFHLPPGTLHSRLKLSPSRKGPIPTSPSTCRPLSSTINGFWGGTVKEQAIF